MTDSVSGEPTEQSLHGREVELDILQRRLHNKTQLAARVIQFNIVALSLVAGILQFAKPSDLRLNLLIFSGGFILLISIFLSVVGISLSGSTLSWPKDAPSNRPSADSLIFEYRSRNRYLGWIMPAALGTGGFGAAIVLIGTFRFGGIEPIVPWWVSSSVAFLFLAGGGVLGFRLARSIGAE